MRRKQRACTEEGTHRALVHWEGALVRVHVAVDHDVHAVLVEQVLQVLLWESEYH